MYKEKNKKSYHLWHISQTIAIEIIKQKAKKILTILGWARGPGAGKPGQPPFYLILTA